jgi:hypothetical protein
VQRYLQWCYDDAFFNAAAQTFALVFFGRNRPGGMLKGINSESFNVCVRGIRNAAWDLVYLSDWARHARANDPRIAWLFCTRDVALLEIARRLVAPRDDGSQEAAQQDVLLRHWSNSDAEAIARYYRDLMHLVNEDPAARDATIKNRRPSDVLLRDLESELSSHFAAGPP